jgi:hypothetical protein
MLLGDSNQRTKGCGIYVVLYEHCIDVSVPGLIFCEV